MLDRNHSLLFRQAVMPLLLLATGAYAATGDVVWMDDFSSETLDLSYWSYDTGFGVDGWGNRELQEYTDSAANVNVGGGQLSITALRNWDGSGFTSGRINTAAKMQFTYGQLEAMILVPDVADGLWPAFWTLGYNYPQVGWPQSGEIDIMEVGQGLAITEGMVNRRVISGAHWQHEGAYATYALGKDLNENLNATFRNFTLDWTPSRLATFVDGEMIWEMDITEVACVDCTELHHPHFVLFNLAVGGYFTSIGGEGSSGGGVASSACMGSAGAGVGSGSAGGCGEARTDVSAPLPATMIVDYVKLIDNGYTNLDTPTSLPPASDNIFDDRDDVPVVVEAPTPEPEISPTSAGASRITMAPSVRGQASFNTDEDCTRSGEFYSGKDGKSGKGDRRRRRRTRGQRRLCSETGSGKSSGSSKSGKGSSKSGELSSFQSALSSGTTSTHSSVSSGLRMVPIVMALWWAILVAY